jgi:acyl-ACP thioesterase
VSAARSDAAPAPFAHVERVRFADLDAMQHLNNVEFLRSSRPRASST